MNSKANWIRKIRQRMSALNVKRDELARLMDMTPGNIGHYFTGRSEPSLPDFLQLLTVLDLQHCTVEEILSEKNNALPAAEYPQPVVARCPILSWEDAVNWPQNKREILEKKIDQLANKIIISQDSYVLQIEDDTMQSEIGESFKEGSYIIVDPNVAHTHGKFVVANQKGRNKLFFRLYKRAQDGRETLSIINEEYKGRRIDVTPDIKICGVVVAHLNVLI